MSRVLIVFISLVCFSSLADFILPEAKHFQTSVPVIWAATNKLPKKVHLYESFQTNFSAIVLSNAMAMGSFKTLDIKSQSKDMVVFESRKNNVLVRQLKISQPHSLIRYFNTVANYSSIHDVPSIDETKRLAFKYLSLFGGDTNQLSARPNPRTEQTVESFNKRGGTMTNEATSIRGIMLCRAIDGIDFSDSFLIDFGNDAEVTTLLMHWRYLEPLKKVKTIPQKDILKMVKAGDAVALPSVLGDFPDNAKSFTITKASLIYRFQKQGTLVYPSIDLETVSDIGQPNAVTNYIECPVITTNLTK